MTKINFQLISLNLLVIYFSAVNSASSKWRSLPTDLYGKPCLNGSSPEGQNLVVCDSFRNMVCSSKKFCECAPSAEFKETEYDQDAKACMPVPSLSDEFRCQTDFQCKVSSYGQFSRCDFDTGRCVCHYDLAPVELVDNICYIVTVHIGQGKLSTWNRSLVRPVPFGENYPSCEEDGVCRASSLGEKSRCNPANSRCECYDTVTGGKNEVGYSNEGKCVYKRRLGEFCDNDEECRVGYHTNAVCRPSSAYLVGEKVCECLTLGTCDGRNGGSSLKIGGGQNSILMMGVTTLVFGLVATKIIN